MLIIYVGTGKDTGILVKNLKFKLEVVFESAFFLKKKTVARPEIIKEVYWKKTNLSSITHF